MPPLSTFSIVDTTMSALNTSTSQVPAESLRTDNIPEPKRKSLLGQLDGADPCCSLTDDETDADIEEGVTALSNLSIASTSSKQQPSTSRRKSCLRRGSAYGIDSDEEEKSTSEATPKMKRNVSFHTIGIRTYDQTMGDHPCVSYGPPLSLDWNYSEEVSIGVEEYETDRPPRRSKRGMLTNYYHRKDVLASYGLSEEEIKENKKKVNRVKTQRYITKYFLPVMFVEDVVTSAGRKAHRMVSKDKKEKKTKEKEFLRQYSI